MHEGKGMLTGKVIDEKARLHGLFVLFLVPMV